MIYVTSDIHGQFNKLRALLDQANFGDEDFLFVLGDVIDRNRDGGVGMLRWMMSRPNVSLILGNHEAMLLSCLFLLEPITEESLNRLTAEQMDLATLWMDNGAEPTLTALKEWLYDEPEAREALIDYLRSAPLFETVTAGDHDYLLVHSGLENFSPKKKLSRYTADELLWHRPHPEDRYFEKIYTILGHTPTDFYGEMNKGKVFVTDTWMDIDTGAAAPEGSPMLLRLEDRKAFYLQESEETL